jgi:hypothetical protein
MARSKVTVTWDLKKLENRVSQILEDFGPLIAFQLQEEISRDQFFWPVDTFRGKPETINPRLVPRGDRDIVDTGQLLNSQTAPEVQRNTLTIQWTAPYSKAVLQGGYSVQSTRGNYTAPQRDWITPALRNRPLLPYLVQRWNQLAGSQ